MAPRVPGVEITHDRNAACIWRPDNKAHPLYIVDCVHSRAEALRQIPMCAFGEKMQVDIAENGSEGIRIFRFLHGLRPVDTEKVGRTARKRTGEQASVFKGLEATQPFAAIARENIGARRAGQEGAHDRAVRSFMRAEKREGIGKPSLPQSVGCRKVSAMHRDVAHPNISSACAIRSTKPRRGMPAQSGRFALS